MAVDAPSSIDRPETATRRPRASLITSVRATRAWNLSRPHLPTVTGLLLVVAGVAMFSQRAAVIVAGAAVLLFDMHVRG